MLDPIVPLPPLLELVEKGALYELVMPTVDDENVWFVSNDLLGDDGQPVHRIGDTADIDGLNLTIWMSSGKDVTKNGGECYLSSPRKTVGAGSPQCEDAKAIGWFLCQEGLLIEGRVGGRWTSAKAVPSSSNTDTSPEKPWEKSCVLLAGTTANIQRATSISKKKPIQVTAE